MRVEGSGVLLRQGRVDGGEDEGGDDQAYAVEDGEVDAPEGRAGEELVLERADGDEAEVEGEVEAEEDEAQLGVGGDVSVVARESIVGWRRGVGTVVHCGCPPVGRRRE